MTAGDASAEFFWLENGKRKKSRKIARRTKTLILEVLPIKNNIDCFIGNIIF